MKLKELKTIRFVQEILGPPRFRNASKAISCNFVLLSSKLLRGAPRNDEKTVLKNSLVNNFGRRYLWATDRRFLVSFRPLYLAFPLRKEDEDEVNPMV